MKSLLIILFFTILSFNGIANEVEKTEEASMFESTFCENVKCSGTGRSYTFIGFYLDSRKDKNSVMLSATYNPEKNGYTDINISADGISKTFSGDYVNIKGICKNKKNGLEELIIAAQNTGSMNEAILYFLYYNTKKKKVMLSEIGTSGDILDEEDMVGLLKEENGVFYCNWRERIKNERNIEKIMKKIRIGKYDFSYNASYDMDLGINKSENENIEGFHAFKTRKISCKSYNKLLKYKSVFRRTLLDNKNWNVKFVYYNGISTEEKHSGAVVVYNKESKTCRNMYQYRFTSYGDYKKNLYYSPKLKSTHLTYIKSNKDKDIKNYFLLKLPDYQVYLMHLKKNSVEYYEDGKTTDTE